MTRQVYGTVLSAVGKDAVWSQSQHSPLGFWNKAKPSTQGIITYHSESSTLHPSGPGRDTAPDWGALPSGAPYLLPGNHATVWFSCLQGRLSQEPHAFLSRSKYWLLHPTLLQTLGQALGIYCTFYQQGSSCCSPPHQSWKHHLTILPLPSAGWEHKPWLRTGG